MSSPFRTPTMTLSTARLPDYDLHIDTQINVRYVFLQYSPTLLVDKTKWKILNAEHYQNFKNSNLKHSDKIILKDVKLQYTR